MRQECALIATEIYAIPDELIDGTAVATRLRSQPSGEGTCEVTLYGVLEPDIDNGDSDECNTDLRWIDPAGEPPSDQPWSCKLPTADDPDTAHAAVSIDEPMTANSYVVYEVRSPIRQTDVGCERGWSWLPSCAGEPDGFPAM